MRLGLAPLGLCQAASLATQETHVSQGYNSSLHAGENEGKLTRTHARVRAQPLLTGPRGPHRAPHPQLQEPLRADQGERGMGFG